MNRISLAITALALCTIPLTDANSETERINIYQISPKAKRVDMPKLNTEIDLYYDGKQVTNFCTINECYELFREDSPR